MLDHPFPARLYYEARNATVESKHNCPALGLFVRDSDIRKNPYSALTPPWLRRLTELDPASREERLFARGSVRDRDVPATVLDPGDRRRGVKARDRLAVLLQWGPAGQHTAAERTKKVGLNIQEQRVQARARLLADVELRH